MKRFTVTAVQIFSGSDSANVAINDKFMIQLGNDGVWDIPYSNLAAWYEDAAQDEAHELHEPEFFVNLFKLPHNIRKLTKKFSNIITQYY